MRIVVAPDKFKGSLSAAALARAVERGWRSVRGARDEIALCPMADGGEGTVAAFIDAGFQAVTVHVRGPLGDPVDATYAFDAGGRTAVIEMAAASGLALLRDDQRDPLRATTYGTGELIADALTRGARRIVVGIGGSATNDAGAGCAQALGVRFLDGDGRVLSDPLGGGALEQVTGIDRAGLDPRLKGARVEVACDVDNPLTGPRGAAAIYGPQKGADAATVARLDKALAHLAAVTAATDLAAKPGAGAAGGLGFGLMAFLGGVPRPGVALVAELRGLEQLLEGADLCLTAEGRVDVQTLMGKTVSGVAALAQRHGVRTIAIAAVVEREEALWERGIAVLPIAERPMDAAESMAQAEPLVERAAARLARLSTALALLGDR